MIKKLFITAAAAAAVSVPLAGAAWATPSEQPNNPPGHPESTNTEPGIPGVTGDVADAFGINPHEGEALPPGQAFSKLKTGVTLEDGTVVGPYEGSNTPERYATAIKGLIGTDLDTLSPGLGIKSGTPACQSGQTGG